MKERKVWFSKSGEIYVSDCCEKDMYTQHWMQFYQKSQTRYFEFHCVKCNEKCNPKEKK